MGSTIVPIPLALALRRGLMGGGVLGLSLMAHIAAVGDARIAPGGPVVWAGLVAIIALMGPRTRWRRRTLMATWTMAATLQLGAHVAMSAAPWAFGLSVHHEAGLLMGPEAWAPHIAAALVLALAVGVLEDLLGCVRRFVGAIARRRATNVASIGRPVRLSWPRPPRGPASRPWACRGPPLVRV